VTPSPHRRSRTVQQDIPRHVTPATHASAAVWGEVLALSREDVEELTEDEVTMYSSVSQDTLGRYLLSKDDEIRSLLESLDQKALELKRKDHASQANAGEQTEDKNAKSSATSTEPETQSADTSKHTNLNAECSQDPAAISVEESDSSEDYIGMITSVGLDASQSSKRQNGSDEFHAHDPLDSPKGLLGVDKRSDDSTVTTTMIELDMPPSTSSDWEVSCQHVTNETSSHAVDDDEQSTARNLAEDDEMIRVLRESVDLANRERAEMKRRLVEMEAQRTKERAEMNDKVLELENELLNQRQKVESMKNSESRLTKYLVEISGDLESYKTECVTYREHVLRKERENAEVEQLLYEEKKKVLSLETENQMLLNIADEKQECDVKSEHVAEKELAACKKQCESYQQQVLELDRRVESAEEALESASQKNSALEQNKRMMEANISEITADRTRLESTLVERNTAIGSLEQNLASKASRQSELETQLAQAKKNAEISDNSVHRFVKKSTELTRRNEELMSRHNETLRELEDATALAMNIDPLKKMVKDNETYIARLHDDLSEERSNNLESLKKARTRYSAEIQDLSDRLRQEKDEKREVEIKNIELADKLAFLEQTCSGIDNIDSVLTSRKNQIIELAKEADELRRKHASSQDDVNALRREISESERAHACKVQEMTDRIDALVREKSEVYETLTSVLELRECRQARESTSRPVEIEELEETVGGRESELTRQHELMKLARQKADEVAVLNATVGGLRPNVKQVNSERDQMSVSGQQFADAMDELRVEKTIIQADLESWNIGCDR